MLKYCSSEYSIHEPLLLLYGPSVVPSYRVSRVEFINFQPYTEILITTASDYEISVRESKYLREFNTEK